MDFITPLINNLALLIALSVVHSLLLRWLRKSSARYQVLSGLLFGGVAIVGMLNAVPVAEGVFFDGRSIILSIAGAFGGPVPAAIAMVVSGGYRLFIGGDGVVMGVLMILFAGAIGTGLFYLRKHYAWASSIPAFLAMGFLVHLVMLALLITLPGSLRTEILPILLIPLLTIFPLGTWLLCMLFRSQETQTALIERLHHSEERFRQVFENSAAIHMLLDPANGQIVDANIAAEKFYGWSLEQLRSMNVREINDLSDEELKKELAAAESGEKKMFQLKHRLASGEARLVDVHAGPVGFGDRKLLFTIVHDVTEQRKNQEDLVRERILLRTVIDNIPDTVYVKDRHFRKTLANKAELEILGKTEAEVIGKTDRDLYPSGEAEAFEADDLRVIEKGETLLNREEKIIGPDGTATWILTSKTPLRGEDGRIVGLVGIGRNINERVEAMAQIEKTKEAAEAANRAKSEFLANMSHEIRTPMNAILGFSEALYHRIENPENKKMLRSVVSSGNLLLSLLNDILDLSKIEAGRLEI
ncbi:MAG: PAS domain S-box protein, partial [Bacteroidales bacterium]